MTTAYNPRHDWAREDDLREKLAEYRAADKAIHDYLISTARANSFDSTAFRRLEQRRLVAAHLMADHLEVALTAAPFHTESESYINH